MQQLTGIRVFTICYTSFCHNFRIEFGDNCNVGSMKFYRCLKTVVCPDMMFVKENHPAIPLKKFNQKTGRRMIMSKFLCNLTEPVVQTQWGKIRGFLYDGIYTFHGIRYAKAKRFLPPQPLKPWEGVKDALSYGFVCPTLSQPRPTGEVLTPHRFWPSSENCQYLNVWSSSLDPKAKKPVMVWFHGGGFSDGSSIEQCSYDGANLARLGDVVSVTVNHRLNVFGFLDLSSFGEKYANSGNAGIADLVAALQWVHENIEQFGGDPDNVTIFGQSGGGGKVTSVGQSPSADGLYHRAIIMSGVMSGGMLSSQISGHDLGLAILEELVPGSDDISLLEQAPTSKFIEAVNKATEKLAKEGKRVGWAPVANDWYLGDPLEVGFTPYHRTVPTMVGTVLGEFFMVAQGEDKESLSPEQRRAVLEKTYGENTDRLIAEFEKAYPGKNIVYANYVDTMFRPGTLNYLRRKAAESTAPTYSYLFAPCFPYAGGTAATHCSDIGYAFHNADLVPATQIEGVTPRLEEQYFTAYVQFAKTGNPNNPTIPEWHPSTEQDLYTMVFDEKTEERVNHDDALQALLKEIKPPFRFDFSAFGDDEDEEPGKAWVY